ncbi:MAG: hypothetical protein SGI88_15675 [Candidatus Hydrogenedentes bacterium]|nr:hypothetical protein [Candidatus Hydrogenedentota bacterium]
MTENLETVRAVRADGRRGGISWLFAGIVGGLSIVVLLFGSIYLLLHIGDYAVEPAVDDYFVSYNTGNFAQVYSDAHPSLAEVSSAEDFLGTSSAVRRTLGQYQIKTVRGISVESDRSGVVTQALYDAEFEHGPATVEFAFSGSGDQLKIAGVTYRSDLLPSPDRRR